MSQFEEALLKTEGMSDAKLCDPCYNSDLEMKTIEYDPEGMPNSQRAVDQARRENLDVIYPEDNQLQIDLDNEHSLRLLQNQLAIVGKFIGSYQYEERLSKSGKPEKKHVTLTFYDVTFTTLERLALQAMLGSDRIRELLGYVQYKNEDPHPVLFLEKKQEQKLLAAAPEDAPGANGLGIMTIPEITESQLNLMNQVCFDPQMSVFSQTSSKEGDSPQAAMMMDKGKADTEYLCSLGFLKDITADHLPKIEEISKETNRTWRVYEVTAMGRAMFQASTSPTKH